jgi:hypothetical protein
VIFTDGLTDAENTKEQELGDERLINCCRTIAAGIGAKEVADRVMEALAEWSVGTEQSDDTTVVVMDVAPRAPPPGGWARKPPEELPYTRPNKLSYATNGPAQQWAPSGLLTRVLSSAVFDATTNRMIVYGGDAYKQLHGTSQRCLVAQRGHRHWSGVVLD